MKKTLFIGALLSALVVPSWASVFFTVDIGNLQDEAEVDLINEGLLFLVSSGADGQFALPVDGGVIDGSSDDEIVAQWDLATALSTEGEYILASGEVEYGGSWAAGYQLAILWFPNLTQANQIPAAGEPYGFYRNTSVEISGDRWVMPEDGVLLHSLKFFTDGQNPLVNSGDVPSFVAAAGLAAGQAAGLPVAPTSVASDESASPGTIQFSWDGASAPGGGYRIERRLQGGSDWTVLGFVEDGVNTYDDSDIGRGKDYEYRAIAINGFEQVLSPIANIQSLRSSLANISTRGVLGSGINSLIVGFTIKGTGDIDVLTRVQGPELARQGVTEFAEDPTAQLFETDFTQAPPASIELDFNDDWGDTEIDDIKALFGRTFAVDNLDDNSTDSGMALTLDGVRVFTVVSSDKAQGDKLGLVEVFDATDESPNDAQNRLVNLATRGFVGTGDEVLIAGFIVDGPVDSRLLVRGLGPALSLPNFGNLNVDDVLPDPTITLRRTDFSVVPPETSVVATNDDWESEGNAEDIIAVSSQVGAGELPAGSKDSVILTDLIPGLYTFVLEGANSETGVGIVEVFLAD